MGYLENKQKNRKEQSMAEIEDLPVVKISEIENPVKFDRVFMKDLAGKFGVKRTAICDLTDSAGERFTCFINNAAIVRELQEGIEDGHDWTTDETFYVFEKIQKKDGSPAWIIREG